MAEPAVEIGQRAAGHRPLPFEALARCADLCRAERCGAATGGNSPKLTFIGWKLRAPASPSALK